MTKKHHNGFRLRGPEWVIKATKKRPNRAFIWNDNYQTGCYVLWPVTSEQLKAEFLSICPDADKNDFNYGITKGGAKYLAKGNISCIAFGSERPTADVVAHECKHFAYYELDCRGIPVADKGGDDSEAHAYFMQWAVREIAALVKARV